MKIAIMHPMQERHWKKIQVDDNGCWIWTSKSGNLKGYGRVGFGPRSNPKYYDAHQFVWRHFNGPVPEGMELDHLCRVKRCVNPGHLEPVPHAVNIQRSKSDLCPYDHVLDGVVRHNGRSHRYCKECDRRRHRESAARKKALV